MPDNFSNIRNNPKNQEDKQQRVTIAKALVSNVGGYRLSVGEK